MKEWKVGVAYERYGYIKVSEDEAKTEQEAIEIAQEKLKAMSETELAAITEYLPDSEEIDEDAVFEVVDDQKLIPPLTLRLYQSIRFNRPVDMIDDCISPGGYELTMKDEDGTEKTVSFDFEIYEGSIDKDDPCVVHFMQKNPDYSEFGDLNTVTEHMLRNIIKVNEWFIYAENLGDDESPIIPVEVFDAKFEIISDSTGRDFPMKQIHIAADIKPCSDNE